MRVLRIFFVVLLLVVLGGGFYLWRLPADGGYRWIASRLGPLRLSGLTGTAWDGHADAVHLMGEDLGALDWQLSKWSLLRGKPQVDLRVSGDELDLAGQLERAQRGVLAVRDLRFSLPAARLQGLLANPDISLGGTLTGVIEGATLSNLLPRELRGSADWNDASITDAHGVLSFARIHAQFAPQADGSIAGTFNDDGSSALAIDGSFTLRPPQWQAQASLRARSDDPALAEFLHGLGTAQADGSRLVQAQGSMLPVR